MNRQLYKSKRNRVLAGVCGGFADYFAIDVTLIRIIWIIVTLFGGAGLIAYIIAAIIMPEETEYTNQGSTWNSTASDSGWDKSTQSSSWTKDPGSAETGYSPDSSDKSEDSWGKAPSYNSDKNRFVIGAALVVIGIAFIVKLIFPGFDAKFFIPLLLIGIGGLVIYKGRH